MEFTKVGVIGAGTMGSGIAQALAVAGIDVVMTDVTPHALEHGMKTIAGGLERLVKKDKLGADAAARAHARIRTATEFGAVKDCSLVIEAASENLELKLKIFAQMDAMLAPRAVIATNTSSLSITRLAAATKRPQQFIGMHFFNPVAVMALVELIRGLQTSDETFAAIEALVKKLGKTPVQVRNSPGFVVNRLLCPMINEAIFALGEGLADAAGIDQAMKLGANHPLGPLALADLIGLDVELAVMQVLYEGFRDPKYRPAPLLVEMVEAGRLGRKTKRGFFSYEDAAAPVKAALAA
jgi:3-hydroxybutyryl-CoA dehydrogenase